MKTQSQLLSTASKMSRSMSMQQQEQNFRLSAPKGFYQPPAVNEYFKTDFNKTRVSRMCGYSRPANHTFYKLF